MQTLDDVLVQGKHARVLLIDADSRTSSVLRRILREHNYSADAAPDLERGLDRLAAGDYTAVVVDADTLGRDALYTLSATASLRADLRFIVLSTRQINGFSCIVKPFDAAELLAAVTLDRDAKSDVGSETQRLVGRSPEMLEMFALIARVAPARTTVLVTGETGTGKELVARRIHELSSRAHKPFVPVNCSALPETLLESELFGHTRGSFTGAVASRSGIFEAAQGGTLFLDEVSTLSPPVQIKLLRVLQERTIQRVGSSERTRVDFRLIAATNVDLTAEVAAGRFREDLYYRINVFPILVPPLRKRTGDVPLLVSHFRVKFSRENDVPAPAIEPEELAWCSAHDWPGNVRELENFVERAVILQGVRPQQVTEARRKTEAQPSVLDSARTEKWDLARMEHEYILKVLADCHGHRTAAARILGIDPRTLYRKLESWS